MKIFYLFLLCTFPIVLIGQDRPAYCDALPATYEKAVALKRKGGGPSKLPTFSTQSVSEYKVQVAILRYSEPADHPFHKSLVARYRPCESVWVVESRDSFKDRSRAERLKNELIGLGYRGAYITELVGFEQECLSDSMDTLPLPVDGFEPLQLRGKGIFTEIAWLQSSYFLLNA